MLWVEMPIYTQGAMYQRESCEEKKNHHVFQVHINQSYTEQNIWIINFLRNNFQKFGGDMKTNMVKILAVDFLEIIS